MKQRGAFLAKATGTFLALVSITGLNFIVQLVLARVLGPQGKGIIAPAMNVATIAIVLASLGLGNSIAYFLDRKPFRPENVMLTALAVTFLSGTVAAAGTWWMIGVVVPETQPLARLFFAGGTLFTVLYSTLQSGLLGRNRIGWINAARLAASLLRTLLCVVLLYSIWPTVEGFAFAYLAAQALNAVIAALLVAKEIGTAGARFDLSFLAKALGFSIAVYLARLALETNASIGTIILKQFRPVEEVGMVAQAQTVARLLMLVPQALAMALYGAVVGEKGKEQFAARAVRLSLLASVALAGILAVFAPGLIPLLFKKAFTPSVPYLWGLLPAMVVYTIPQLYTSLVIASWGKPWHFFIASAMGLAINAGGCLLLVPVLNAWGMIIAYNAGVLAMAVYYVVLLWKKGGLSLRDIFIPRMQDFRLLLRRGKSSVN